MAGQVASLADQAQERIISGSVWFRLTPPQQGIRLGETDAAHEIGMGLVKEAMHLLQSAAEKEGFHVEIEYSQVVY